jgi:uncharacterized lipoprotein YmbA
MGHTKPSLRHRASFCAGLLLICVGCVQSTPPVKYYTLSPIESVMKTRVVSADAGSGPTIGVYPVVISSIYDKTKIVTRMDSNRIQVDEFHRWAGPFQENIASVLAENLMAAFPESHVAVYPWDDAVSPVFRLKLSLYQFDGSWDHGVRLVSQWIITARHLSDKPIVRTSVIEETMTSNTYEALVTAQSVALAALSREIAHEIRQHMP